MKIIKFYAKNRFILVAFFIGLFLVVNYLYTGQLLPDTDTKDFWFYSGLLLLLFSILFVEPFYSSPKNIITNSLPLLLTYIAIKNDFKDLTLWWWTFGLISGCIVLSVISLALQSQEESFESVSNRISNVIRKFVVIFGNGKTIYSIVFISVIFLYKNELDSEFGANYFMVMILLWGFILSINPKTLHSRFRMAVEVINKDSIGEIFSVQSNSMYLVKLFEDKSNIKKFDLIEFRDSLDKNSKQINQGIVFDTYKLSSQKWAKVIQLSSEVVKKSILSKNIVYKIASKEREGLLKESLRTSSFVGVIIEGSTIGKVKFEYSKELDNLQEGALIEIVVQNKTVLYQVFEGVTEFERLENKNESGFIEGEAIQLGVWNVDDLSFDKFGWVPNINTPVFIADTDKYEMQDIKQPEYVLGKIPDTKLPSVINLEEAVSHHTALLGVTGAGKSFLAKEIISELTELGTKVICIDFTGEWKKSVTMKSLTSANLVEFLDSSENEIGLVELPTVSNTVQVIESTEKFISKVFSKAKEAFEANSPRKICLVLEEAHTIVPEGSFLGVNDWDSKAVVNKMGQVALQGRKYGVGLMVIGQRTANISKTVLTQCNTIICFQAFDETSYQFLGNYIGKDLVQSLPNLKKYHAVVTGKAFRSNMPMIIDLTRDKKNE